MFEEQLRQAQIRLCFTTTPAAQAVAVINGLILIAMLRVAVPIATLWFWFGALAAVAVFRLISYALYLRDDEFPARVALWENIARFSAGASGCVWGAASIFLFVPGSVPHQAFLSFVIAGMVAGVVTTFSVQFISAVVFIACALLPLSLQFAMAGHQFSYAMTGMVLLFMVMMITTSWRFYRTYRATVTESLKREAAEKELAQIAYYDPLTGLSNRRLFSDHMRRAISASKRAGKLIAVCYLDLDGFAPINERHGHESGDRVLIDVANEIQAIIRGDDVAARWGGDEFAVLLTNLADRHACEIALRRLEDRLGHVKASDDPEFVVSASIGVSISDGGRE